MVKTLHLFGLNQRHNELSTHETERTQNGESLYIGQTKFNKTQKNNDDIKTAPLVLQVLVQTKSHDLQRCFRRENGRKNLRDQLHYNVHIATNLFCI